MNKKTYTQCFNDLAVSGGGASGIGVASALKAMPKSIRDRIKRVTATSVGALITGPFSAGLVPDLLDKHVWVFVNEILTQLNKNMFRGMTIKNDRLLLNTVKNAVEIGAYFSLKDLLKTNQSEKNLIQKLENTISNKFGFLSVEQKERIVSIARKWHHSKKNKLTKSTVPDINKSNQNGLGMLTFAELKLLSDVFPERFKEFRCFTTKERRGSLVKTLKAIFIQLFNAVFVQIMWGTIRFLLGLLLSLFTDKIFFSGSLLVKPTGLLLCNELTPDMTIVDGIAASSALPPVFNRRQHNINGNEEFLRDGGLYNNSGINVFNDDHNSDKQKIDKTIWVIYSTTDYYQDDKNTDFLHQKEKPKLSKRRLLDITNRYLGDSIDAILSIFFLPFIGLENTSINRMHYCHQKAVQMGYEPIILTTEGHGSTKFNRTHNETNAVKRNAYFAMIYFLRKKGVVDPIYSDAIVIHMMKTILTALINVKKELYFIQFSMSNDRLFSENLESLMEKFQTDIGKKYGVTSLTYYTLRLSEAIIHFEMTRSEVFNILVEKTKLKKVDLISLFGSGYNQIEAFVLQQQNTNTWKNHPLKSDLDKLMSIYQRFSGVQKNN
ncbi:patatin-like phospholipase family protein [Chlamydiia bacterium]|nr:patatin-like phospholipase family protein [Chlamydiia bacterium]